MQHEIVSIAGKEYLMFDVSGDNHCLFHSLAAVLKPVYGARGPTYEEVREGLIAFYSRCTGRLRQILEIDWLGISQMSDRAKKLKENKKEWGEHMDIQAAAIFFDVQFQVATFNRRSKRVYTEDIRSYHRNGRRSTTAETSP